MVCISFITSSSGESVNPGISKRFLDEYKFFLNFMLKHLDYAAGWSELNELERLRFVGSVHPSLVEVLNDGFKLVIDIFNFEFVLSR